MGRNRAEKAAGLGRLKQAAEAVRRLLTRDRTEPAGLEAQDVRNEVRRARQTPAGSARPTRREADIPLDVIDGAYVPPVTSSKSSFRSDGIDHQQDQEFATGSSDERWNDEDHFTNKSGDPRIGTRRRTYEPAGDRAESRK